MSKTTPRNIFKQPIAVWAIAFACAVSFMGIGLVDPILPAISRELNASPTQTMLLFTSYLLITALAMFFSVFISSRIGVKKTLLTGLALIVVFAFLSGAAGSVDTVIFGPEAILSTIFVIRRALGHPEQGFPRRTPRKGR